jgi:hypothetical protein
MHHHGWRSRVAAGARSGVASIADGLQARSVAAAAIAKVDEERMVHPDKIES